ncbi:MAG: gluconokinase [Acidobacteriota bacterium]
MADRPRDDRAHVGAHLGTVVVMGVSGAGKTTVGRLLAAGLGWRFEDGDDHHPEANLRKMADGIPLGDDDRRPWLRRLRDIIEDQLIQAARGTPGMVLACSALKQDYRLLLGVPRPGATLVHLSGSRELLEERLSDRRGHFMPTHLLDSQLETLEPPGSEALHVDVAEAPEALCRTIADHLGLPWYAPPATQPVHQENPR